VELSQEGGVAVLWHDSVVEKGPPWLVSASEVTGGRRSGGGGGGTQVGVLHRLEETAVELSAASMSE
jgi:hypothetical protein